MHDLIIINDRGRRFGVRIVHEGERYGRDDCLVHDEREPLVEFYDMTYADQPGFGPRGQFVSRYYRCTLMDHHFGGIDLYGGVDAWKVDAFAMDQVRRLLAHTIREEVTA